MTVSPSLFGSRILPCIVLAHEVYVPPAGSHRKREWWRCRLATTFCIEVPRMQSTKTNFRDSHTAQRRYAPAWARTRRWCGTIGLCRPDNQSLAYWELTEPRPQGQGYEGKPEGDVTQPSQGIS